MGFPALAKPSAKSGGSLVSSTLIGVDTSAIFVLRLYGADLGFRTIVKNFMGDGNATPQPEHNNILYGRHVLLGWMLNNQALQISNLSSSTNNICTAWTIYLDSNLSLTMSMLVEAINLRIRKEEEVGVAMVTHLGNSGVTEA